MSIDKSAAADRAKKRVAEAIRSGSISTNDAKWRKAVHEAVTTRVGSEVGHPQVNRLLVEHLAVIASVAYSNLVPDVEPVAHHRLDLDPETTPTEAAEAVRLLLTQWTQRPDVRTSIEKALVLALVDRDAALEVVLGGEPNHPLDRAALIPLSNVEAFWDRKAKSYEAMSYAGKVIDVPLAEMQERYPECQEALKELAQGATGSARIRRIEFYDYDGSWEVDLTSAPKDEGAGVPVDDDSDAPQQRKIPGRMMVLAAALDGQLESGNMVLLREGPCPYTDKNDRPLKTIMPLILISSPDETLGGLSMAEALYPPVKQINRNREWLADVANAEAAFTTFIMADPSQMDEKQADEIKNKTKARVIPWKAPERGDTSRPAFQRPPTLQVSDAISRNGNEAQGDADRIGTVAPLSYGETMKYAKATAASLVGQYNETTVARMRHALDLTMARLLPIVMRLIAIEFDDMVESKTQAALDGELEAVVIPSSVDLMDPSGKVVTVFRAYFDHPWRFAVSEVASTPMAEAQAKSDLTQLYPLLRQAAQDMGDPNPYVAAMAKAFSTSAYRLYRLPREFDPARIDAAAKKLAQETPPEPTPAPSGMPGGAQPLGGLPPGMGG